ncbi:MerR family transcriptional regulator [Rhodococcus kyotonensis]|uniref:MerR family transcriptional regulator n=1 Tax=Rhodococcoides kyotonense TaxID=398843 RepID=A0A177YH84_9NOCA|nr:MerR family transcriptional regulator [Rhodococcus kyotonensis]OAK54835.1 MerR family transcriptional regulator [Rhodococcus kyotonensis]
MTTSGLSVHALRHFEREGLLLRPIKRAGSKHRMYDASDINWLLLINRFRESGMPVATIRQFAELVRSGPGNEADRLQILRAHEAAIEQKIATLRENLDVIRTKVAIYADHVNHGTAVGVWSPRPSSQQEDDERSRGEAHDGSKEEEA